MKVLKFSLLICSFSILFTACEKDDSDKLPAIQQDQFKVDANGWSIIGDAQGGYVAASYSPNGGVEDGYIYAIDDVVGGVWYFNAPSAYLGNKSNYYDATLSYSLFQDSKMRDQFLFEDIVFSSDSLKLFYMYDSKEKFPKKEWTKYSIKINENTPGWYVGTYKDSYNGPIKPYSVATKQDMEKVLSNLTSFIIRGEFETGDDTGGLDNVFIRK
ncbi:MAG TPA: laminin B domain-containing protein [Edaphocola sp.]|nr:laminin B domain-containing protein [Edaphocola sp.]